MFGLQVDGKQAPLPSSSCPRRRSNHSHWKTISWRYRPKMRYTDSIRIKISGSIKKPLGRTSKHHTGLSATRSKYHQSSLFQVMQDFGRSVDQDGASYSTISKITVIHVR